MKEYFALGSYTEPILFGTGQVFEGKGKGITVCSFENGVIEKLTETPVRNPSFLCVDAKKKKLYSVNEMKEYLGRPGGGMTQFAMGGGFELTEEGTWNVGGTDPCHIALSPDGGFVSTANFASGSITVFPLDERGFVRGDSSLFQHEGHSIHPKRQTGPHAHSCVFHPDENIMYVPDLGTDRVNAYRFCAGRVRRDGAYSFAVAPGSGPRYGEFSRDGRHFYLINEIGSQVMHYVCDRGHMECMDTLDTLPCGYTGDNICSDLHLTPDGKLLYASNRGHDSIVCCRVDTDGRLSLIERVPCGGRTPRNFAVDPGGEYLLVGNQDSDNITVFSIDDDGRLTQTGDYPTGSPVCICFF